MFSITSVYITISYASTLPGNSNKDVQNEISWIHSLLEISKKSAGRLRPTIFPFVVRLHLRFSAQELNTYNIHVIICRHSSVQNMRLSSKVTLRNGRHKSWNVLQSKYKYSMSSFLFLFFLRGIGTHAGYFRSKLIYINIIAFIVINVM